MEWRDEGVVVGVRAHGETSAIAEILTAEHGRYLGMVRGGRSRHMRPVLQPGNLVMITWRARISRSDVTKAAHSWSKCAGCQML